MFCFIADLTQSSACLPENAEGLKGLSQPLLALASLGVRMPSFLRISSRFCANSTGHSDGSFPSLTHWLNPFCSALSTDTAQCWKSRILSRPLGSRVMLGLAFRKI